MTKLCIDAIMFPVDVAVHARRLTQIFDDFEYKVLVLPYALPELQWLLSYR